MGAVSAATRINIAGAEGGKEQVTEVAPGARGWKCTECKNGKFSVRMPWSN